MPQGVQVQPLLPAPPRQKKPAAFRFRGFRKSIATREKRATIKACPESSTSTFSFFLSKTGVSRGTPVSVLNGSCLLVCITRQGWFCPRAVRRQRRHLPRQVPGPRRGGKLHVRRSRLCWVSTASCLFKNDGGNTCVFCSCCHFVLENWTISDIIIRKRQTKHKLKFGEQV